MKTITLKHTGYVIKGIADITLWGGGNGCIEMKPFETKDKTKITLLNNINDNGFGVENLNGAICDIYENFEGTLKFLHSVNIGKISDNTINFYADNI